MHLHQQFLVFPGPGEAEEETSLTECSDRLFAALLLRGECPTDELKLYKIEVLRKFKSKLQAITRANSMRATARASRANELAFRLLSAGDPSG